MVLFGKKELHRNGNFYIFQSQKKRKKKININILVTLPNRVITWTFLLKSNLTVDLKLQLNRSSSQSPSKISNVNQTLIQFSDKNFTLSS